MFLMFLYIWCFARRATFVWYSSGSVKEYTAVCLVYFENNFCLKVKWIFLFLTCHKGCTAKLWLSWTTAHLKTAPSKTLLCVNRRQTRRWFKFREFPNPFGWSKETAWRDGCRGYRNTYLTPCIPDKHSAVGSCRRRADLPFSVWIRPEEDQQNCK